MIATSITSPYQHVNSECYNGVSYSWMASYINVYFMPMA